MEAHAQGPTSSMHPCCDMTEHDVQYCLMHTLAWLMKTMEIQAMVWLVAGLSTSKAMHMSRQHYQYRARTTWLCACALASCGRGSWCLHDNHMLGWLQATPSAKKYFKNVVACGEKASSITSKTVPRGRPPFRCWSKSARPVETSTWPCSPALVPASVFRNTAQGTISAQPALEAPGARGRTGVHPRRSGTLRLLSGAPPPAACLTKLLAMAEPPLSRPRRAGLAPTGCAGGAVRCNKERISVGCRSSLRSGRVPGLLASSLVAYTHSGKRAPLKRKVQGTFVKIDCLNVCEPHSRHLSG